MRRDDDLPQAERPILLRGDTHSLEVQRHAGLLEPLQEVIVICDSKALCVAHHMNLTKNFKSRQRTKARKENRPYRKRFKAFKEKMDDGSWICVFMRVDNGD